MAQKKKRRELMTFDARGLRFRIEAMRRDFPELHGLNLGETIAYLLRYAMRKIRGDRQTLASIVADSFYDKRYPWYDQDHVVTKEKFAEEAMLTVQQVDLIFAEDATVSDEIISAVAAVLERDLEELLAIAYGTNSKINGENHAEQRN